MKISVFLTFFFSLQLFAVDSYSQSARLSLHLEDVKIKDVLVQIENQSEFYFLYNGKLVDVDRTISIHADNRAISDVLDQLFDSKDVAVKVVDRQIVLLPASMEPGFQAASVAQGIIITGTVTDANGEPLPGASVVVKGTTQGTVTDVNGNYSLSVPDENTTLVFSFVGYDTQEMIVGSQRAINISLEEGVKEIEEVVVVGYGMQKKINLTGSVASVGEEKLSNRPTPNLSTALVGLVPGLRITQGSGNPRGENVSFQIRGVSSINGSSPMILVDGVSTAMTMINPDDVESISILKDAASASIYGSRAANGVVLVTTKRGKNEKPKVTASALFAREQAVTSLKFLSDTPTWMKLHNEGQRNASPGTTSFWYTNELIEAWEEANKIPNGTYTDPVTGNTIPNWLAFPNTDWAQEWFKPSMYYRYNLSVSGGSDVTQYLLSASYQENPGMIENTGMKRFNIRTNVDSKIAGFLTVGTQTYAIKEFQDQGNVAMTYFFQAHPGIYPKYNGKYGGVGGTGGSIDLTGNNLLYQVEASEGGGQYELTRISTTWYANADIWNGISAEARFNYYDYQTQDYKHSKNLSQYSFTQDRMLTTPTLDNANTYRYSSFQKNYTANLFLRYNGSFGSHDINALVGYEQYYIVSSGFYIRARGLLDWDVTDITSASEVNSWGGDVKTALGILSYFGRVNYAYKHKYLFEANFRKDGSSRFAPEYRWGTFPSFSAGWRISEESFFEPLKSAVDNLKMRASWGKLGNQVSGNYDWQSVYSKVNTVLDEKVQSSVIPSQMPNYLMSWEKITASNIGLEAAFLKRRLNVEFDYFIKKTTDMLVRPRQFITSGSVTTPMINDAEMKNKGFDMSIGWNDKAGDFRYGANINLSYSVNKITKYQGKLIYEEDPEILDVWGNPTWRYTNFSDVTSGSTAITVEGHQFGEYYYRQPYSGTGTHTKNGAVDPKGGPKDGMIRTRADLDWVRDMIAIGYSFDNKAVDPSGGGNLWYGEMLFEDKNSDGKFGNNDDRVFTKKSSIPKWIFGLNLFAEWKGFDLNMIWSGCLGAHHYIYACGSNASHFSISTDALPANALNMYYRYDAVAAAENGGINDYDPAMDTNANYMGKFPRIMAGGSTTIANTFYLYNTSYLKLKSLQVGYTLPKKWLAPAKISNIHVFVTGENLLTIQDKDFPGVDPELGANLNIYPLLRMFSGGVTITF